MSPQADIRTEYHARAILRLDAGDPPSAWRAAFQREVKAAHPDQGGDSERLRLVIEAYRFLKTRDAASNAAPPPRPQSKPQQRSARPAPPPEPEIAPEPPPTAAEPQPDPPVLISIVEAFRGAERMVRLKGGKSFKVRLPSGLQTGDVVRFGADGEHRLTIAVESMPRAELKGADLWLSVGVSAEFLKEGGRIELDTPLGPRKFWVSRTSADRGIYRVPGEGLPPRGGRGKGHLYMRLELDLTLSESASKSLLARFASVWAAE